MHTQLKQDNIKNKYIWERLTINSHVAILATRHLGEGIVMNTMQTYTQNNLLKKQPANFPLPHI